MSIVAGVDFGTLSVRVSVFDSVQGRLGAGAAEYPLLRKKEDPDHATQSHADHMAALAAATHRAIENAAIDGHAIEAIALDTTGSSVIPVDAHLNPIDDYYLWCDHRNHAGARGIEREPRDGVTIHAGIFEGAPGGGGQRGHVVGVALRGVVRVLLFAQQRVRSRAGAKTALDGVEDGNANAEGAEIYSGDDAHVKKSPCIRSGR